MVTTVNNAKKYTPPNKTLNQHAINPHANATEKKSLRKATSKEKEFSLLDQSEAFPSLSSAYKDNSNNSKSFANATKTEIKKETKLISDVKPGWVHIRKHNREFQFKYGPPSDRNPFPCEISDIRFGEMLVKCRLAKEQWDRDRDVDGLGDLSEYYGEKTIQELFEEREHLLKKSFDSNSSNNNSDNEIL